MRTCFAKQSGRYGWLLDKSDKIHNSQREISRIWLIDPARPIFVFEAGRATQMNR